MAFNKLTFIFYSLTFSVLFYGLFLEPTPGEVSPELLIFILVLSVVTLISISFVRKFLLYQLCFYAIAIIGVIGSIISTPDHTQVIRDFISFSYLPMTLSLCTILPKRLEFTENFPLFMSFSGLALSIRYVWDPSISLIQILVADVRLNFMYLSSEPLVMFASLFFLRKSFNATKLAETITYLILSALALLGILAAGFRGPVVVWLLIVAFAIVVKVIQNRGLTKIYLSIFASIILTTGYLSGAIAMVITKIIEKSAKVGSNGKVDEIIFLFKLDRSFWEMLVGSGFGGSWPSPIFQYTNVAYTHNVLTYFYMKFGLLGVMIFLIPVCRVLYLLIVRPKNFITHYPAVLTLLYIGLAQAAYKHLGFSIIFMSLLVALETQHRLKSRVMT